MVRGDVPFPFLLSVSPRLLCGRHFESRLRCRREECSAFQKGSALRTQFVGPTPVLTLLPSGQGLSATTMFRVDAQYRHAQKIMIFVVCGYFQSTAVSMVFSLWASVAEPFRNGDCAEPAPGLGMRESQAQAKLDELESF